MRTLIVALCIVAAIAAGDLSESDAAMKEQMKQQGDYVEERQAMYTPAKQTFPEPTKKNYIVSPKAAAVEENGGKSAVLTLTTSTFDDVVASHEYIVVAFFAPWCNHCKELHPHWEEAAQLLAANPDVNAVLAQIDASGHEDDAALNSLMKRNGFNGFPTLKTFVNGAVKDYRGPRGPSTGIHDFIEQDFGAAAPVLTSLEDLRQFRETIGLSFLVMVETLGEGEVASAQKTAHALRHRANFGLTDDTEIISSFGLSKDDLPTGVMLRNFALEDAQDILFERDGSGLLELTAEGTEALHGFILYHSTPLLGEFTSPTVEERYIATFLKTRAPTALIMVGDGQQHLVTESTALRKVAKNYDRQVFFSYANVDRLSQAALRWFRIAEPRSRHDPELAALDVDTFPRVVVTNSDGLRVVSEPLNLDDEAGIAGFVQGALTNQIQPRFMNELPPRQGAHPVTNVTRLVGSTWGDIVSDVETDVLVMFWDPDEANSQAVEGVYREVADHFADEPRVVIAAIDASDNDIPRSLGIIFHPSIVLFTQKDKVSGSYDETNKAELYRGQREVDQMIDFVKIRGSFGLYQPPEPANLIEWFHFRTIDLLVGVFGEEAMLKAIENGLHSKVFSVFAALLGLLITRELWIWRKNAKSFAAYKPRVVEFYKKHNPDRLEDVNSLLHCFAGREEELLRQMREKYTKKDN